MTVLPTFAFDEDNEDARARAGCNSIMANGRNDDFDSASFTRICISLLIGKAFCRHSVFGNRIARRNRKILLQRVHCTTTNDLW